MASNRQAQALSLLRIGWPILVLLGILWFPFDWLSTVWPAFGAVFQQVFRTTRDHLVGHTVFFLIVGLLILGYVTALRRRPLWYLVGLALAALMQETIQAVFAGRLPTFSDTNAFTGDALGGSSAFVIWWIILMLRKRRHTRVIASP